MQRVKARMDAVVQRSNEGVANWLKGLDNCTVYEGHARLEGSHTVRVDEQQLEAERIFINVGARAYVPPLPGLDRVEYLTNSGMMNVDFLPEHLVIVGGGVHRPGICADVPTFRQPGDGARDGRPTDSTGVGGRLRGGQGGFLSPRVSRCD